MVLRSDKNEYRGVNAHLHSYFQNRGDWEVFHTKHISDLSEAITAVLPPGYTVVPERSLQIRELPPLEPERRVMTKPDLTIATTRPDAARSTTPGAASVPSLTQPIIDTLELDEFEHYPALVIYQDERPVTRIELLSPSNKQGYGRLNYLDKRIATLRAGLRLVELDYLHQTPTVLVNVPLYPADDDAFAYTITVNDPRPSLHQGQTDIYGCTVDAPLPTVALPLAGDDRCLLDFDAAYQRTFTSLPFYASRVDYADLPAHFDSYSAADQARIRQRMADVKQRLGA